MAISMNLLVRFLTTLFVSFLFFQQLHAEVTMVKEHGNDVYLLQSSSDQIVRYDLATQSFGTAVTLSTGVSAFDFDDQYIYLGVEDESQYYVARLSLSDLTAAPEHLRNIDTKILGLWVDGDYLLVHSGSENDDFWSLEKATGVEVDRYGDGTTADEDVTDTPEHPYSFAAVALVQGQNEIFAKTGGSETQRFIFSYVDGEIGRPTVYAEEDTPFVDSAEYMDNQFFLFEDAGIMVGDSGLIYSLGDVDHDEFVLLNYIQGGSYKTQSFKNEAIVDILPDGIDVAGMVNGAVVSAEMEDDNCSEDVGRTKVTIHYPDTYLTNRIGYSDIDVQYIGDIGGSVLLIGENANSQIVASILEINDTNFPTPTIPTKIFDPTEVSAEIDKVYLGGDNDTLYTFYSNECYANVFRYSISSGSYLTSYSISFEPDLVTVLASNNTMYLVYNGEFAGGESYYFVKSLNLTDGSEDMYHNRRNDDKAKAKVHQITSLDTHLLVTLNHDGGTQSRETWTTGATATDVSELTSDTLSSCCNQTVEFWASAENKLVYITDSDGVKVITMSIGADGVLPTTATVTPGFNPLEGEVVNSIAASPDGSELLMSSGRIFRTSDLVQVDVITQDVAAGLWVDNDTLITIRETGNGSMLERWVRTASSDGHYGLAAASQVIDGSPLQLFPSTTAGEIISVVSINGVLAASSVDSNLAVTDPVTGNPGPGPGGGGGGGSSTPSRSSGGGPLNPGGLVVLGVLVGLNSLRSRKKPKTFH